MIPMIDLLMVTISFLLITAVWSHMARINADAQVPGPPRPTEVEKVEPDKQLHIEMKAPDKFLLIWKQSGTVINSIEVPRKNPESPVRQGNVDTYRYPELAAKIESEWKTVGSHGRGTDPTADPKLDQAVLHTDNETPYSKLIGVIDAIYQVHRPYKVGGKIENVPAFNVTFSVN
jgi:biopolymer transport protein ExbD